MVAAAPGAQPPRPLTTWVGRRAETARVRRALGAARLVTVVGGDAAARRTALRQASGYYQRAMDVA